MSVAIQMNREITNTRIRIERSLCRRQHVGMAGGACSAAVDEEGRRGVCSVGGDGALCFPLVRSDVAVGMFPSWVAVVRDHR
jgi:hypothetical protein